MDSAKEMTPNKLLFSPHLKTASLRLRKQLTHAALLSLNGDTYTCGTHVLGWKGVSCVLARPSDLQHISSSSLASVWNLLEGRGETTRGTRRAAVITHYSLSRGCSLVLCPTCGRRFCAAPYGPRLGTCFPLPPPRCPGELPNDGTEAAEEEEEELHVFLLVLTLPA